MLCTIAFPALARAQQAPAGRIRDAHPGDCSILVEITGHKPGDVVEVTIGGGKLPPRTVTGQEREIEFPTVTPIQKGYVLRLLINGQQAAPDTTVGDRLRDAPRRGACSEAPEPATSESSFDASAYLGIAIDAFAPSTVGNYPPGTASSMKVRELFGVDFDYRLAGSDDGPVALWIAGQTLHGVRTADIDCSVSPPPAVCSKTASPGEKARYVLQHATSLEAYVSPRLEFLTLQRGSTTPAKLYVTARLGFIAMTDAPSVFKSSHVGVGLLADDGPFAGSQLEVGWGNNELLGQPKWNRLKIDGLLTFSLERIVTTDAARFFIEMYIDNDVKGAGSDSIQTFVGMDLDIRKFFGG